MADLNFFYSFKEDLAEKVHNLDTDTLKVVLTNTEPSLSTNTTLSDITQIANGNGYTTDGVDVQNGTSSSGGTTSITGVDVVWTAIGNLGPFRYVVLYNSTPAAKPLIGYWSYSTNLTLLAGETFTLDVGSALFTIS